MRKSPIHRALRLIPIACLPAFAQFDNDFKISFHGAGWWQQGLIGKTTDTLVSQNNYSGNVLMNTGALFNMNFDFNPNLQGALGIGAIKQHNPLGTFQASNVKNLGYGNYTFINLAKFTYNADGTGNKTRLKFTAGLFDYKYDDNIRNLGLYLIRGTVYPQLLVSGFETGEMVGSANMEGFHLQSDFGDFTQDVLLISEMHMFPRYDFSALYIGKYSFGGVLELGGGVNFYHYLPINADVTSPSDALYDPKEGSGKNRLDPKFALPIVNGNGDTAGYEWYSNKGIVLMGRFMLDFKPITGTGGIFGPEEFKLYGEAALIGVKNYEVIYKNRMERMPLMLGVALPAWRILDELKLEVEYFKNPYMPNSAKVVKNTSPIPIDEHLGKDADGKPIVYDVKADDVKWSLYLSKVLAGHVKLSGQIANDHSRFGTGRPLDPSYDETLSALKDWYVTGKIAFFF
jgi:hypothetical protein